MTGTTSVVRVWLEPYEQHDCLRQDTESVRMLIRGPNTSGTVALLCSAPVESTTPAGRHDRAPVDEHLRAGAMEADPRWLSAADVIVTGWRNTGPADVFTRFPGCLVAAVAHQSRAFLVATAAGGRICFVPSRSGPYIGGAVAPYASLVHTWLVAGRPLGTLHAARIVVWCGRGARRDAWISVRSLPRDQENPETDWRAGG